MSTPPTPASCPPRAPAAVGAPDPRVVVAVLTYQRPDDLAAVLPLVVAQVASVQPPGRVLVVDNDPAAGAREAVAGAGESVAYAHEPRPGIAAARNRALDQGAEADVLVFLDDDERPGPSWLRHLLATRVATGADGVVGPVVSSFAAPPDPWVAAGRFFERRRLPTGTPVTVAATNNLLLDVAAVRRSGVRFDDRFGLSGGSDTLFTRQLVREGLRLVWCAEAVVTDVVPAQRATRGWVLRRALRSGNGWARTSLALHRGPGERWRARAALAGQGLLRVAGGCARSCLGVLLRRVDQRARGLRTLARGAGMLSGLVGWSYVEYRRPTPVPSAKATHARGRAVKGSR